MWWAGQSILQGGEDIHLDRFRVIFETIVIVTQKVKAKIKIML